MKHRLFFTILVIVILIQSLIPEVVLADTEYKYIFDNAAGKVYRVKTSDGWNFMFFEGMNRMVCNGYEGGSREIALPAEIDGHPVTLGDMTIPFNQIERFEIPEYFSEVDSYTFGNISDLQHGCTIVIYNRNADISLPIGVCQSMDFVLSGYTGSTTEQYASSNNLPFLAIRGNKVETPYLKIDAGFDKGLRASAFGGRGMDIGIDSNTDWSVHVTEGSEWITLSCTTGSGKGSFYTTIATNNDRNEREGYIEITAAECKTIKIKITQDESIIEDEDDSVHACSAKAPTSEICTDHDFKNSKCKKCGFEVYIYLGKSTIKVGETIKLSTNLNEGDYLFSVGKNLSLSGNKVTALAAGKGNIYLYYKNSGRTVASCSVMIECKEHIFNSSDYYETVEYKADAGNHIVIVTTYGVCMCGEESVIERTYEKAEHVDNNSNQKCDLCEADMIVAQRYKYNTMESLNRFDVPAYVFDPNSISKAVFLNARENAPIPYCVAADMEAFGWGDEVEYSIGDDSEITYGAGHSATLLIDENGNGMLFEVGQYTYNEKNPLESNRVAGGLVKYATYLSADQIDAMLRGESYSFDTGFAVYVDKYGWYSASTYNSSNWDNAAVFEVDYSHGAEMFKRVKEVYEDETRYLLTMHDCDHYALVVLLAGLDGKDKLGISACNSLTPNGTYEKIENYVKNNGNGRMYIYDEK